MKGKSKKKKIPEGKALCILGAKTRLRKFFFKLVKEDKFEFFIIFAILISTLSLIFQNPLKDPSDTDQKNWKTVDMITTIIFSLEALCKMLAYGFVCNGENSYLRSFENCFDFIIVLSALSNLALKGSSMAKSMSKLKTLRILRVIRPLRIISRSE